jgi:hypothetical protein
MPPHATIASRCQLDAKRLATFRVHSALHVNVFLEACSTMQHTNTLRLDTPNVSEVGGRVSLTDRNVWDTSRDTNRDANQCTNRDTNRDTNRGTIRDRNDPPKSNNNINTIHVRHTGSVGRIFPDAASTARTTRTRTRKTEHYFQAGGEHE